MKRRRGDMSLFEILREPEDHSKERPDPKTGTAGTAAGSNRIAAATSAGAVGERVISSPLGSSTPPEPTPEPRPRLDVTPPSRSSRKKAASALPELAPELTSTPLDLDPPPQGIGSEGSSPAAAADQWWVRPILVTPPVLIIAAVGLILVGYISFQAGVSSANQTEEMREAYTGGDTAEWHLDGQPVLHSNAGPRAEVRYVTNEKGEEIGGATGNGEFFEYPVIIVASGLGKENDKKAWENVGRLTRYIQTHTVEGSAQVTVLNNELAVYIGAFASNAAADDYQKRVINKIKKFEGTSFAERDNMRMTLEYTEADLEFIPVIGS